MAGFVQSRVSTSSWFVKTVRSGARYSDGSLPPEVWQAGGVCPTLNTGDNTGEARATILTVTSLTGDRTHTLTSEGADASEDGTGRGTPIVAFSHTAGIDCKPSEDVTPTVLAGHDRMPAVSGHAVVRRLTPLECERLQGFPDGWTDVPGATDSARYKQCGNAVTVNVFDWVIGRIVAVDSSSEVAS